MHATVFIFSQNTESLDNFLLLVKFISRKAIVRFLLVWLNQLTGLHPPLMLAKVREKCRLGSPPKDHNQNANEAINSLIKSAKGPGKLSLKETMQLLQKDVRG